jgi:hypothetical protein
MAGPDRLAPLAARTLLPYTCGQPGFLLGRIILALSGCYRETNMIRILLGLALSIVVCASFASCNKPAEDTTTPPAAESTEPVTE